MDPSGHPVNWGMRKSFNLLLFFLSAQLAYALEPNSLFSDNVVLQRGMDVPIWGVAAANEEVTVKFAGQTVSGKADADGKWRVALKSLEASAENRSMTISSGEKSKTIENVLVGDVWLGSGQSNMAGRVSSYAKNDPTLAKLVTDGPYPTLRLRGAGKWAVADETSMTAFSAIHLAFGERLHRDLKVPIGLIFGAVGGTPSGAWIPSETYESSEKCKAVIAEFAKTWDRDRAQKQAEAKLAAWEKQVAAAKAAGEKPRGRKPGPLFEPGASTRGGKIGGLFDNHIRRNVGFAMRGVLWDQGEGGTGILGLDQHTSMSELIRGWRDLWGQGDFAFLFVQKPSGQGNAFSNDDPITREGDAFKALPDITKIGNGEGRFLYTRLMLDNENSWMVPAIDLGSSIHPKNKWGYGNRAAQVAEQMVYEMDVQAYGPIYESHSSDGAKVTVHFSQVGEGLAVQHAESIQGFAVAGEDGVWHWAEATIDGNAIVLSSEAVPAPKDVRYAWSQNRTFANLFNKAGLPALSFSTDQ
ncbi:MAG: sialate O-acetylesterase [Verrucomicrobiales bacterium]|jgi:sialate O-acetylesterase